MPFIIVGFYFVFMYGSIYIRIDNKAVFFQPAFWLHRTSSAWKGKAASTAVRTRPGTAAPRTLRTTQ